jgi:glycerol-3-phosphate acyltransferase PlsY
MHHIFNEQPENITKYAILTFLFTLITMVSAYLLGSVNTAIIVSRVLYNGDIRKHGSGNPGLTNMLRTYGKGAALLTLLGDLMKTALAVVIAAVFFGFNYIHGVSTGDGYCYVAALFAVIGHMFPVYYKFKGGKGVLSTAVAFLILAPIPALIALTIFVLIVATSKYVSLGSISAAILLPVILNGYFNIVLNAKTPGLASLSTIIIAILIVWCHRGNIQRISDRTERKISFRKKDKGDGNE